MCNLINRAKTRSEQDVALRVAQEAQSGRAQGAACYARSQPNRTERRAHCAPQRGRCCCGTSVCTTLDWLPSACPAWKSTRPADAAAVHKTIEYIANECINNNWYRKDDGSDDEAHYLYLTDRHWETILAEFFSKPGVTLELEGGYGFLDDEGGTAGMICLSFAGLCNPKWTFRVNAQGKIAYTTVSG